MTEDLRYPIGPFQPVERGSSETRQRAIEAVASLPRHIREAVQGLTAAQLDTPYRPGGWTVRQVVHHVADSHMNGFIRAKLALTEDRPTIKPYDENAWSTLPDAVLPIDLSLCILDGLHSRWAALYPQLPAEAFERTFFHPQMNQEFTLDRHLQLYAWHSRHHVAHITALRDRQQW